MDEKDRKIQELTEENVRLRNRLAEAIGKACFNCEEYQGHDEKRCAWCPICKMKSMS